MYIAADKISATTMPIANNPPNAPPQKLAANAFQLSGLTITLSKTILYIGNESIKRFSVDFGKH